MRIHSKEFKAEDAIAIGQPVRGHLEVTEEQLGFLAQHHAYTIFADDTPLACVGALPLWPGVKDLWAVVSPLLRECPRKRTVFKLIQRLLLEHAIEHGVNRYQCEVIEGWEDGRRFARLLGLRSEGIMEAYGMSGEDMHRYIWLMKEHT